MLSFQVLLTYVVIVSMAAETLRLQFYRFEGDVLIGRDQIVAGRKYEDAYHRRYGQRCGRHDEGSRVSET